MTEQNEQPLRKKTTTTEIEYREAIENELHFYKGLGHIESEINEEMSSDFVWARFDEKRKDDIEDFFNNAYFTKNMLESMLKKMAQPKGYRNELPGFTLVGVQGVKDNIRALFKFYMIRPTSNAALRRNETLNPLIDKILKHKAETPGEEPEEEEDKKGSKKLIKELKRQLKKKEEA